VPTVEKLFELLATVALGEDFTFLGEPGGPWTIPARGSWERGKERRNGNLAATEQTR